VQTWEEFRKNLADFYYILFVAKQFYKEGSGGGGKGGEVGKPIKIF